MTDPTIGMFVGDAEVERRRRRTSMTDKSIDKATPRPVDVLCPHGWAQDIRCEECERSGFAWIGVNIELENEMQPRSLKLYNRADGVDGHYCIGRPMPDNPAFVHYWNKGKWTGFGELFADKESAELRLKELLELDQLRTQNAALREALEKIRDECHPRDLKDVEGLCSGCVAGRALEEVK